MSNILDYCQLAMQQKQAEEDYKDFREFRRSVSKAQIQVETSYQKQRNGIILRQEEEERKRGEYEEISLTEEGEFLVTTINLSIDAPSRRVTNMRSASLFIAERESNSVEKVFIIDCQVEGKRQLIFLNPEKIGSGSYLLQKMAVAGISVFASSARAKDYVKKLLTFLIRQGIQVTIPDEPGWIEIEKNKFIFIKEEEMTWEKVRELVK